MKIHRVVLIETYKISTPILPYNSAEKRFRGLKVVNFFMCITIFCVIV